MTAQFLLVLLLGTVVVVYGAVALVAWFRMRGTRVVVCPETNDAVAVTVDAAHSAMSALWENGDIRIKTCTHWPERQDCDQGCAAQIAIAPHDTRATAILAHFFEGKRCVVCGRDIPPVHAAEQHPGLRYPATGAILSWADIPAEHIPDVLATHEPVCASCQVNERFRQRFPDLVTDRPARPEQDVYQ